MSLDRIMLIVVCIVGAVGLSTWFIGAFVAVQVVSPLLKFVVVAFAILVIYVIWRLLAERLNNPDEDHYDNMDN